MTISKQLAGDEAATTGTGESPLRPNMTWRRSVCSVFVGMPVLGPADLQGEVTEDAQPGLLADSGKALVDKAVAIYRTTGADIGIVPRTGGGTDAAYAALDGTPVSLAGWSIQYAANTGTSWSRTNLTAVTLAPGQFYLVQLSAGAASADITVNTVVPTLGSLDAIGRGNAGMAEEAWRAAILAARYTQPDSRLRGNDDCKAALWIF